MINFISTYSAGKVKIKFRVLAPLVGNRRRKIILNSLIVFLLFMLFIILPMTAQMFGLPVVGITLVVTLILMVSVDFYTKNTLFAVEHVGNVLFEGESLKQFDREKNLILELPYTKIQKIEFKRNVPKSAIFPDYRISKTLIVQFIMSKKEVVTIELSNEMYLTREEVEVFREIDPDLERVLMQIKPKFGVERVGKLNF